MIIVIIGWEAKSKTCGNLPTKIPVNFQNYRVKIYTKRNKHRTSITHTESTVSLSQLTQFHKHSPQKTLKAGNPYIQFNSIFHSVVAVSGCVSFCICAIYPQDYNNFTVFPYISWVFSEFFGTQNLAS